MIFNILFKHVLCKHFISIYQFNGGFRSWFRGRSCHFIKHFFNINTYLHAKNMLFCWFRKGSWAFICLISTLVLTGVFQKHFWIHSNIIILFNFFHPKRIFHLHYFLFCLIISLKFGQLENNSSAAVHEIFLSTLCIFWKNCNFTSQ